MTRPIRHMLSVIISVGLPVTRKAHGTLAYVGNYTGVVSLRKDTLVWVMSCADDSQLDSTLREKGVPCFDALLHATNVWWEWGWWKGEGRPDVSGEGQYSGMSKGPLSETKPHVECLEVGCDWEQTHWQATVDVLQPIKHFWVLTMNLKLLEFSGISKIGVQLKINLPVLHEYIFCTLTKALTLCSHCLNEKLVSHLLPQGRRCEKWEDCHQAWLSSTQQWDNKCRVRCVGVCHKLAHVRMWMQAAGCSMDSGTWITLFR